MKTRIKLTKILALATAVAILAAIVGVWGGKTAQAIIIVNSKTGLFTVAPGEAARIHVVNINRVGGIAPCVKIFDRNGSLLAEFEERALGPAQSITFVYLPPDPVQPMSIRVELMVEGDARRERDVMFIPTLEVFDVATGRTGVGYDPGIFDFNPQPEPPIE